MITMNKILSVACLLALGLMPFQVIKAQVPGATKLLTGLVVNSDGEPIQGATVKIPYTRLYTMTDSKGYYSIGVSSLVNSIEVSAKGMQTRHIDVTSDPTSSVVLESDPHLKDATFRLAQTQTSTREALTGSVSVVEGNKLVKSPTAGLSARLAGNLSGLSMVNGTSDPGYDGVTFFVRGRRSTNGNDPLIVLDGVPSPTTDINTLDPHMIESVVILKDAAATAVYGFQASNGAILINTKRGVMGKTQISASADFSIQRPTVTPKVMDAWEYCTLRNQALANDGLPQAYSASQIDGYRNGTDPILYPNNNWYNMFTHDYAPMQRYNVNATGGNERVRYFINGSYLHQGALYKTEKASNYDPHPALDRFNVVSNMDVTLLDNLSAFLNANIVIDKQNRPNAGGIWSALLTTPPVMNGPLTPDGGVVASDYELNPVYGRLNRNGYQRDTRSTINVSIGLDWNLDFITKGLKASGILGYESRYVGTMTGGRDYMRYVFSGIDEGIDDDGNSYRTPVYTSYGSNQDTPLGLGKGSSMRYFMNILGTLSYDRTFGRHSVEASVSYFNQDYVKENGAGSEMLPYDRIAFSGHAKYGYDHRYYLEFDAGYTSSEQFNKDHRWGFFPTVSGAWVISNEHFFKNSAASTWLTFLKLRASYGKVGNDIIAGRRFLYLDEYSIGGGGLIGNVHGGARVYEGQIGNPLLQWETTREQNYGVEIGLFNCLTLRADYYYQRTKDIVLQSQLTPDFQGIPRNNLPYRNLGESKNQGIELELVFNKRFSKDLQLTVSGNLSTNRNEVVKFDEMNKGVYDYYYPYRTTGYGIGQSWGYLIDYSNGNGFFNSQTEIDNSNLTYEGTQPRVGDFIYRDLNGDGIINEKDLAPIGNTDLPQTTYAFDFQIEYKAFDLYAQFLGTSGRTIMSGGLGVWENDGRGVYTDIHREAWTAERYAAGETISYPALSTVSSSSMRNNDFFITNRNFLRLKNIEIGYTLPRSVTSRIFIEKARVYLSANNLLTFDNRKFKSFDVESGNLSSYPIYRTFNVGLNLNF